MLTKGESAAPLNPPVPMNSARPRHPLFAALALAAWCLPVETSAQIDRTKAATTPITRVAEVAERRLAVEGLSTPLQALQVTDLSGRDLSAEVKPRTERGTVTLDLSQRQAVVLKPRDIATLPIRASEKIVLPGGVILPSPEGTTPAPVWFRLTLTPSPMPAPWDSVRRSYATRLTFGLQRPAGAPASVTLDRPILVKIDYQGIEAEPAEVRIEAPGLEHEKTVDLFFKPLTATPTLRVRSALSDVNLELAALPRLDLLPNRTRVLGLGLDEVAIAVQRVHPDGRLLPVAHTTTVALAIDGRATLAESEPAIAAGEASARLTLRTAGLGPLTVRATADGVTGSTILDQQFPVGPLLAALLGGALGGYARRFMKGARRALTGRRIVEGLVVAVIAFVAGVLGVGYLQLPAAIVATEAGAFLTGALTAFAGVNVLETLLQKNSARAET